MITQCGPRCDVCGNFILTDRSINPFKIGGIERELHAHDKCADFVREMQAKQDWKVLPEGPLKDAYNKIFNGPERAAAILKQTLRKFHEEQNGHGRR